MRHNRGFTLLEMVIVLALLALTMGLGYPPTRTAADVWAVRAARDATAAAFASVRAAAVAHRGAELLLVPAEGIVMTRSVAHPQPRTRLRLHEDWGVTLLAPGSGADTVVIRYDAIGLGRLANRTIRFVRGRAQAGITVAAYGRVRRW